VTGLAYIWKKEEVGQSDALTVAFLEANRDGSRGAVACRLAADDGQRDRVNGEQEEGSLLHQCVVDQWIPSRRQERN